MKTGFCFLLWMLLSSSILAQKGFLLTDKELYFSGERISIAYWTGSRTFNNEHSKFVALDWVSPEGEVIFCDKKPIQSEFLTWKLPSSLKTGFYRIVANYKDEVTVKWIPVFNPDDPAGNPTAESNEVAQIMVRSVQGAFIPHKQNELIIRTLDKKGNGVSGFISVFNETDSLITVLESDEMGFALFKTDSFQQKYRFQNDRLTVEILRLNENETYFDYQIQKDSLQLKIHASAEPDFNQKTFFQIVSDKGKLLISIPMHGQKNQSITVPLSDFNSSSYVRAQLVLNDSTIQEAKVLLNPSVNNETVTPHLIQKNVFSIDIDEDVKALSVRVFDAKNDLVIPKSLGLQLFLQNKYPLYAQVNPLLINGLLQFDYYREMDLNAYRNNHLGNEFDCQKNRDKIISFLLINSWKGYSIPCDSLAKVREILNRYNHTETAVMGYLFQTNRNHVEPISLQSKQPHSYPRYSLMPKWNAGISKKAKIAKKMALVEKNYKKEAEIEEKNKLVFNTTYRFKDYYIRGSLPSFMKQIIPEIHVKIDGRGQLKNLQIQPYKTRNPFPFSPLLIVNNIPTYDLQILQDLDPRLVDSVSIMNTYTNFKSLGEFGKNGVLAVYLKVGVENPLEGKQYQQEILSPVENPIHKQINEIDLRALIQWKHVNLNIPNALLIPIHYPLYESIFGVSIQGLNQNGSVIDTTFILPYRNTSTL